MPSISGIQVMSNTYSKNYIDTAEALETSTQYLTFTGIPGQSYDDAIDFMV